MRNVIIFSVLVVLSFLTNISAQDIHPESPIQFDTLVIDLGEIKKGEQPSESFQFKNISDQDVEIDIVSTCDCTEAKWTTEIVKPGEQGEISFTFLSEKKDDNEEIALDVFLKNTAKNGDPIYAFLIYKYQFVD